MWNAGDPSCLVAKFTDALAQEGHAARFECLVIFLVFCIVLDKTMKRSGRENSLLELSGGK